MRFLLILCTFFTLFFGEIIAPQKAFKVSSGSDLQGVFVHIKLADEIYLYKNQLKIILNDDDITNLLALPNFTQKLGESVYYGTLSLNLPTHFLKAREIKNANLKIFYQGCSNDGFCYRPMSAKFDIFASGEAFKIKPFKQKDKFTQTLENSHLAVILAVFFGYGILLSLTPCTLPLIPILSGLILTQANGENYKPSKKRAFILSLVFVLFMSLAYAIAGIITALLGASLQGILQKPLVLGIFAAILFILALNCFGLFSLNLPQNLAKFKVKISGVLGVAIMGFVSAFVVGPCVVAPLAAALLYIATTQDVILGGFALFVLSLGMGIPLIAISLGFGFLKAGEWVKRVNFIFGFLILLTAIWILSRVLSLEIVLILLGILGVFFAIFMGIFEGAKSNLLKLKQGFLILIFTLSLMLFLGGIFGIFAVKFNENLNTNLSENLSENSGENLSSNSGKNLSENDGLNLENLNTNLSENLSQKTSKNSLNLSKNSSLNFTFLSDLNEIKMHLKDGSNPTMLYFTASWCENCKLLEKLTFSDDSVKNALKNYDLIKIDISENSTPNLQIMREFGVFAPPVIIFFNADIEISRLVGFVNADEFLKNLRF